VPYGIYNSADCNAWGDRDDKVFRPQDKGNKYMVSVIIVPLYFTVLTWA
jgi:hypothetical protein